MSKIFFIGVQQGAQKEIFFSLNIRGERIFGLKKNIFLKSIKDDHADGYRSGSGLIRSILGELEIPSQKNRTFITIWRSWFSYEFPLVPQRP